MRRNAIEKNAINPSGRYGAGMIGIGIWRLGFETASLRGAALGDGFILQDVRCASIEEADLKRWIL